MENTEQNHDISDAVWARLSPHLPGQAGQWGGIASDNRQFLNGTFWVLRTGAPWRDMPPCYGNWNTAYQRFRRWRNKRIWEKILEVLLVDPDYEWLMMETSHAKLPPKEGEAAGGNQEMDRAKEGSARRFIWPWMVMVCQSEALSQQLPLLIAGRLSR